METNNRTRKEVLREGFKNPRHGNFPLGGYPPPPPPGPPRTRFFRKVNGNFFLHGRSVSENGYFFAESGAFCPKNTVFGPFFNGFLFNGKGGHPPSPLHGRSVPENLTGKFPCRGFLKPSLIPSELE